MGGEKMKSKLIFPIICVLLVVLSVGTALAYEEVSKWGITGSNAGWLSGGMDTDDYVYNWSDIGIGNNSVLVADITGDTTNEIIQNRNGTIKIYYLNGTLMYSSALSGLGDRQLTIYDADSCSAGVGIYAVFDTGQMIVYCWESSTLTYHRVCTPTMDSTNNFIGASVYEISGHNYAVYAGYDSGAEKVAFCDETADSVSTYNLPSDTNTWSGVAPHGNMKNDGNEYWLFPYFIYNNATDSDFGFSIINKAGSKTDVRPTSLTNITNSAGFNPTAIQPIVIKRGSGQPDDVLLPYMTYFSSANRVSLWYGDTTGYTYTTTFYTGGYSTGTASYYSQPIQLGVNGDICVLFTHGVNPQFICKDPTSLSNTYYHSQSGLGSEFRRLSGMDMDGDDYADFILSGNGDAIICYYINNITALNCSNLYSTDDAYYAYGVDIDGDSERDIIMQDSTTNHLRVFMTSGVPSAPPTNASCNDTDYAGSYPTWNDLVQGTISGTNITNATDSCYNSTMLIEQACLNSTTALSPVYIDCYADYSGGSCSAGACVEGNISYCSDTDYNGTYPSLNYYEQGIRSGTNLTSAEDYCVGNILMEYSCLSSSSGMNYSSSFNCSSVGKVCEVGECVSPAPTPVCIDSDVNATEPNFIKGNVTIMVGSTQQYFANDSCYNSTHVRERYCYNSTTPSVTYDDCTALDGTCLNGLCDLSASEDCVAEGGTFIGGECVFPQGDCTSGSDSYTYPTLWLETFPYIDAVTNHGWDGYGFVPGENLYDSCNILFMDYNEDTDPLMYDFGSPQASDFVFRWDMMLEATTDYPSYIPNGMPVNILLVTQDYNGALNDIAIYLEFGADGIIYNSLSTGGVAIGNWQDVMGSYKVVVNPVNHTFKFYYTNSTNYLDYVEGCSNCSFRNNVTIRKLSVEPQPPYPETYESVGVWLDNLKLTLGEEEVVEQNVTNYCYFDGCIFHDHFDYADDTYTHGWYLFNTTPSQSFVVVANSTGYYFDHAFNTFRNTDAGGVMSIQFRALLPQPSPTTADYIHFYLYPNNIGGNYSLVPIDMQFSDGIIFANGVSAGTYAYNAWNTYTLLVNLNTNRFDLYSNNNKLISSGTISHPATSVNKIGFWVNTGSSIYIDYVTLANSSVLVDSISGGVSDTGVPLADLRWCWSETNGSFNWDCCSASENQTKSLWCPARVTGRYFLGGIATFVLNNFIYFLILVIIFVIIIPFIVPGLRKPQ
jgi:hypothetical protein